MSRLAKAVMPSIRNTLPPESVSMTWVMRPPRPMATMPTMMPAAAVAMATPAMLRAPSASETMISLQPL